MSCLYSKQEDYLTIKRKKERKSEGKNVCVSSGLTEGKDHTAPRVG